MCKACAQFLPNDTFPFLSELPAELSHTRYCTGCHSQHVEPALGEYEETVERAKGAFIFFKTQKAQIPVLKKAKEKITVDGGVDRDETILKLAFLATRDGYNALVETEVTSRKIRDAGYQKSAWRGEGVPALVDAERLERHERRDD